MVIGKPGKDISIEAAHDHVLAYCTVNDVSSVSSVGRSGSHRRRRDVSQITSRGLAAKGGQVGFGKSYDSAFLVHAPLRAAHPFQTLAHASLFDSQPGRPSALPSSVQQLWAIL